MTSNSYQSIQHLIDIRRFSQARREVEEALKANPNDTQLLFYSAYVYWLQDEYMAGIEVAQAGLSLAPDDHGLRYIFFCLLKDDGQYEAAESIIIDLIRSNPRHTDYIRGYAELMLLTFHIYKAKKLIAEALRIDPDNTSNHLISVLIDVADGKLKDSEKKLQKLIAKNPENADVLRVLLNQLIEKKKYRSALVMAQELLRGNPYDQQLISVIIQLRSATHWSAIPLWPFNRFGWIGSIALWLAFLAVVRMENVQAIPGFNYFVWGYIGWVIYSWVHRPLLQRFLQWRGV